MRAIAAGVVIGALLGGAILPLTGHAQPAPDLARAKDLYKSAEAAVKDGRFSDAARDYGGAFEITKDPVLFYKIGSANERAGRCDLALIYYGRYLHEAHPSEAFVKQTKERIVACGGDPNKAAVPTTGIGSNAGSGSSAGSASTGSGSSAGSAEPAGSGAGSATLTGLGSAGSASAKPTAPHAGSNKAAWILVASSIGLVTVGGVLAYAASSSENDISDLYVGLGGMPPVWDAKTMKSYQDLQDEGNRYAHLSWVSFGLAGATALTAAILFVRHSKANKVEVAPAISANSASLGAVVQF